jgi:nitrate/TMAO reductase-like tetraheme cytochrome c subunit
MLVLLVIVVLIILSVMFGGFQKGTKSGGLAPTNPSCTSCLSASMDRRGLV